MITGILSAIALFKKDNELSLIFGWFALFEVVLTMLIVGDILK